VKAGSQLVHWFAVRKTGAARGGGWNCIPPRYRSAMRFSFSPDLKAPIGFRVVVSVPKK